MLQKHCPGRRARGDAEFGSERIIIGMRAAIRHLKTSRLSRKDIAEFAGVTPPLVSYYFPDREALLEAATLSVVKSFADDVARCLSRDAPPERVLWDVIELILAVRARDGAVIDAYAKFRECHPSQKSNPLVAAENMLGSFFERWLNAGGSGGCYALLARLSLLGMCEYVSQRSEGGDRQQCQFIYQVILCIIKASETSSPDIIVFSEKTARETADADRRCLIGT